MAGQGQIGRSNKGVRKPTMVRLPLTDHQEYVELAAKAGLPLGDYLALQLARAHGRPEPAYIERASREQMSMAC